MIKKIILAASLSLIASASFAAPLCENNGTAGNGKEFAGDSTQFVVTSFTPKCSANTEVEGDQDASGFWGASASTKGKTYFGGHTAGGAVKALKECDKGTCATGVAKSKIDEAKALGSGS